MPDGNITSNATTNSTLWNPFDVSRLSGIEQFFKDFETYIVQTLLDWKLDPFHSVFLLLIVVVSFFVMSQLYIMVTSKSSGIFKPVVYIIIVIVILLLLGVI